MSLVAEGRLCGIQEPRLRVASASNAALREVRVTDNRNIVPEEHLTMFRAVMVADAETPVWIRQ